MHYQLIMILLLSLALNLLSISVFSAEMGDLATSPRPILRKGELQASSPSAKQSQSQSPSIRERDKQIRFIPTNAGEFSQSVSASYAPSFHSCASSPLLTQEEKSDVRVLHSPQMTKHRSCHDQLDDESNMKQEMGVLATPASGIRPRMSFPTNTEAYIEQIEEEFEKWATIHLSLPSLIDVKIYVTEYVNVSAVPPAVGFVGGVCGIWGTWYAVDCVVC